LYRHAIREGSQAEKKPWSISVQCGLGHHAWNRQRVDILRERRRIEELLTAAALRRPRWPLRTPATPLTPLPTLAPLPALTPLPTLTILAATTTAATMTTRGLTTDDPHVRHANPLEVPAILLMCVSLKATLDQCVEEGKKRQLSRICDPRASAQAAHTDIKKFSNLTDLQHPWEDQTPPASTTATTHRHAPVR
jgi:hypothetical protein